MSMDRKTLLTRGGLASAAIVAGSGATATAAVAKTRVRRAGKKRLLVWTTHFFYGFPIALNYPIAFRDFLDPIGWDFKFFGARESDNIQQTIAADQQALQLKPDAVIASMANPTAYNKAIAALVKGVPYVGLTNAQPDEGNPWGIPFVGQSFVGSGVASMNALLDQVVKNGKKSGSILIGRCCPTGVPVQLRTVGQHQGITAYNKKHGTSFKAVEFLDHSETDVTQSASLWAAKMRQLGKDLVGAAQDGAGDPEIAAAKQLGMKPGQVPFICHDVSVDRLNFLKQGWFVGLVDQQPYAQGYISAAQAVMYVDYVNKPELTYDTGSAIVTQKDYPRIVEREAKLQERAKKYGYKV
jgi:ABC-type sugar transport system substrate-binding protein